MSLTPIFDATLADAPRNIWQASNIFPRPDFAALWADLLPEAPEWAVADSRLKAKVTGRFPDWSDPANLGIVA